MKALLKIPLLCSHNGKNVLHIFNLKCHIRKHTGENLFQYNLCDKSFSDDTALITDMRILTGDKPHTCSICGKDFKDNSKFVNHLRTHTWETVSMQSLWNDFSTSRFSQ